MNFSIFIPVSAVFFIAMFWLIFSKGSQGVEPFRIGSSSYGDAINRAEIVRTVQSLLVFGLMGLGMDYCIKIGWSNLRFEFNSSSLIYFPFSLLLSFLLFDLYFYLSHRFLHWKPVFRTVHRLHHLSHSPNPLSAFSFHPLEAFIQIFGIPLICLILPMHVYIAYILIGFTMLISVYGHAGFELRAGKSPIMHIFNTAIHHHQHHRYVKYNFGIYLSIWDKLFNTMHFTYEREVREMHEKISKD
jgi:sterol desaturase/sphingolipid hydroxylase (fatty acid hydroxylase superfamily)